MPKKVRKYYVVEVGDDLCFFAYGRGLTETKLLKTFERRLEGLQSEVFPGLKLRNQEGLLLEPRLQVILVPAEE